MEIEALLNVDLNKLLSNLFIVVVSIILYVITGIIVFLFISFFFGLLFSINIYFYLKKRRREKRLIEIREGIIKYNPIELSYNDFIKLDNEYYNISCVLYEDLETEKYKFICTINNKRLRSIEALMNYSFNGKKLSNYNKIIIMEIDNKNPKEFY